MVVLRLRNGNIVLRWDILTFCRACTTRSEIAYKGRFDLRRNKKLVGFKTGVVSRKAVDLILAKCEDLHLTQSVWGRIFGFGTITVTTGGLQVYIRL